MSFVSVWGVDPEDLKKQRYDAARQAKAGEEAVKLPVVTLCERVGMSLQNDYKSRKVRERKKVDEVLAKRLVEAEREVQPREGNPRGSRAWVEPNKSMLRDPGLHFWHLRPIVGCMNFLFFSMLEIPWNPATHENGDQAIIQTTDEDKQLTPEDIDREWKETNCSGCHIGVPVL